MNWYLLYEPMIIAIAAFVYSELLTEPGMIFYPLFKIISKLPAVLNKPLMCCVYCVAGQMGLWLFLYLHWSDYSVLHHVGYVSMAVFVTHLIMTANYKLNK